MALCGSAAVAAVGACLDVSGHSYAPGAPLQVCGVCDVCVVWGGGDLLCCAVLCVLCACTLCACAVCGRGAFLFPLLLFSAQQYAVICTAMHLIIQAYECVNSPNQHWDIEEVQVLAHVARGGEGAGAGSGASPGSYTITSVYDPKLKWGGRCLAACAV